MNIPSHKGFAVTPVVMLVITVAAIAGGGYYVVKEKPHPDQREEEIAKKIQQSETPALKVREVYPQEISSKKDDLIPIPSRLTEEQAFAIAKDSSCDTDGILDQELSYYDEEKKGWQFTLKPKDETACDAECFVGDEDQSARTEWHCGFGGVPSIREESENASVVDDEFIENL